MAPRTVGNTDAGDRERFEFSFSPFPRAVAKFPSGQPGVTGSRECWFGSQLRLGIAVGAVRAFSWPIHSTISLVTAGVHSSISSVAVGFC